MPHDTAAGIFPPRGCFSISQFQEVRNMRLKMFLTVALGLLACAGSYLELAARCRCDRPARGERKAFRQERRATRRGYSTQSYIPSTPSYNPYDSGVQPLGAATEQPRFRWECNGGSCRLVPIAPQAKAADCPAPTAPAKTPEPEPTKEETQEVIEPPAFENLLEPTGAIDPTTAWRPDPPAPQRLPGWDD